MLLTPQKQKMPFEYLTDEELEELTREELISHIKKIQSYKISCEEKIYEKTPHGIFSNIIDDETKKELDSKKIWSHSEWSNITNLQSNNSGRAGERFLNKMCEYNDIESSINGEGTKKFGGGCCGDGLINGKSVEIKTAWLGKSGSFQHELGEYPWIADYMAFIDIEPDAITLTIFENFTETKYKRCGAGEKCGADTPFPTKSITRRKGKGNFKLDTTRRINKMSKERGKSIIITSSTTFADIGSYINRIII